MIYQAEPRDANVRIPTNCLRIACLFLLATRPGIADDAKSPPQEQKWGHLTGRFVYDGPVPRRDVLELNKDIEFCGKFMPRDEELIVDARTRGIKNVVIWLDVPSTDEAPPIHPDYKESAQDKVRLDNADCRFDPHICVLRTTQPLVIGNKDKINHNAAVFFFKNDPFNENIPFGETVVKNLSKPERLPAKVSCPIHAWMRGYVVVKDHPYVAVTDEKGNFEITNLPVGEWTVRVWQEKVGYVSSVTMGDQTQEWKTGQVTVTISPGDNSWGDVKLAPKLFEK